MIKLFNFISYFDINLFYDKLGMLVYLILLLMNVPLLRRCSL